MLYFLQEKNNTDRVSFYTPQIVSSMVTQALLDELDDAPVQVGKQVGRDLGGNQGLNILITPSLDPSGKDFAEILFSNRNLIPLCEPLRSNLSDWGKSLSYNFEAKRPKLIPGGKNSPPLIIVRPFPLHSPNLPLYMKHLASLAVSLSLAVQEMVGEKHELW